MRSNRVSDESDSWSAKIALGIGENMLVTDKKNEMMERR